MKEKIEIIQKTAQNDADKILLAHALDQLETCRIRNYATHTRFLDLRERTLLIQAVQLADGSSQMLLTGGYPEAERAVAVFFPEYLTPETAADAAELTFLRAAKHPTDCLTHRDYLGALMGLQIDRSCIGDILVHDTGADLIVTNEIADFLLLHFDRAGRRHLTVSRIAPDMLKLPQTEETIQEGNVASARLDCMIAEIFHISRTEAQQSIAKGLVFVNLLQVLKPEKILCAGDRLTLRGKGRARILAFTGQSRKGRLFLQYCCSSS